MRVNTFRVECQRRLRVHQPGGACKWDSLEVGVFPRAQGKDQGAIGGEVDFAKPVVRQSLVELPDHVGKPRLVAVVAMVGNRLAELKPCILRLDSKRCLSTYSWRQRTQDGGGTAFSWRSLSCRRCWCSLEANGGADTSRSSDHCCAFQEGSPGRRSDGVLLRTLGWRGVFVVHPVFLDYSKRCTIGQFTIIPVDPNGAPPGPVRNPCSTR